MKLKAVVTSLLFGLLASAAVAQLTRPTPPARPAAPGVVPRVPPPSGTPTAAPALRELLPGEDSWTEMMRTYYDVQKFPKDRMIRLSATRVRPLRNMNLVMELLDEDETHIYVRNLPIEDPDSRAHRSWWLREAMEVKSLKKRAEAEARFTLDPLVEYVAPLFTDRLHLQEQSVGLPPQGRWQMGLAFGDLNGDGLQDLALPPARLGTPTPWVVLQTATGWQRWDEVTWPQLKFDYGDVAVADFDGDGHQDIAIACHFKKSYVLYGNGKGDFTRHIELPQLNPGMSSRALAVADFDSDQRPDVALLCELDVNQATTAPLLGGLLQVTLNTKDGWQGVSASGKLGRLYGDHLATGDLNGDGRPDLVAGSHMNQNDFYLFTNGGDGRSWNALESADLPYLAYVFGVAAGRLGVGSQDAAVLGVLQFLKVGETQLPVNGLLLYSLESTDPLKLNRKILAVDERELDNYTCATVADVDGDGRPDLLAGRRAGGVEIYLQGLDGQLMAERSPEISLGDAYVNDLAVVPTGQPGERAVVAMLSDGDKSPGGIKSFVVRKGPLDKAPTGR